MNAICKLLSRIWAVSKVLLLTILAIAAVLTFFFPYIMLLVLGVILVIIHLCKKEGIKALFEGILILTIAGTIFARKMNKALEASGECAGCNVYEKVLYVTKSFNTVLGRTFEIGKETIGDAYEEYIDELEKNME